MLVAKDDLSFGELAELVPLVEVRQKLIIELHNSSIYRYVYRIPPSVQI